MDVYDIVPQYSIQLMSYWDLFLGFTNEDLNNEGARIKHFPEVQSVS